jgi:beta-lactamase class A
LEGNKTARVGVSRVPNWRGYLPAVAAVAAITAASTTAAVSTAPAATTAVAATSATVTTTAAAPATAAGALCLRPCFVHHEVSPAEILTVQRIDRAIRVFVTVHFDEREAA